MKISAQKVHWEDYFPVSRIDDMNFFDLIRGKNQEGEDFYVRKGDRKYLYKGFGNFELGEIKNMRFVGIVAQGAGMANLFQLIEGISTNGDDTNLSVLHFYDNIEEI